MSNNNNNNISNNNNNNNNNNSNPGKCGESYCSSCMHHHRSCSGVSRSGSMNGNNSYNNNNNNGQSGGYGIGNGIGVGGGVGGIPPIQVTAKVLFGSVSAISALNAERKKKST